MAATERATGVRDTTYDVISVLYHELQGADTLEQYLKDARDAGEQEVARFFEEVQQRQRETAQRAKDLLAARLGRA